MLILLAACSDFRRETSSEGGREGLEAVENADNTLLFGKGRVFYNCISQKIII